MKTIIQVWTHKCVNMPQNDTQNFWGIGDMLRGTIFLFQLCKKHNYKFIVDIQLHNLSNYLEYETHEYTDIIKQNENNIPFVCEVENYIKNNDNDVLYFFTNRYVETQLDDETKSFMKKLLSPNKELKDYISYTLNNIPNNYNIIHYRLGDEELVRNNSNNNINKYIEHFKKNVENNDLLLSDSPFFKNTIKNLEFNGTNTIMLDIVPKHIGYSNNESIKDTLLEFFLITKAVKIKTYSIYFWTSGFVTWISNIYDIPLIKI